MAQPVQPMYDAQGNLINQSQRQIVTQNPAGLTGGQVIRTVTQRNVREFKDGKVNERAVEIHTLNARTQKSSTPAVAQAKDPLNYEEEEGVEIFTLSMGSIISGTLLNGVAAPTSSDRKQEPMPVLMRVKREALMPNSYTLDIIDCHLLGSAIGDLSSNRAYIRAEAISCNTANGEAIEKQITAYAVSSTDGMAGIQGDVVFKSGAMIANSLKAEFIRGFADTLSPRRVQSLNTSPGASELWQTQNLDRATGAGLGNGMSSAAGRIADKYMDMADAAHPVIELLPGIEVDFIVQRGMTLKLGGREAPYTGNRMGDKENNIKTNATNNLPSVSVNVN
jgi:conjugal transfer pilus assembly protein TraB